MAESEAAGGAGFAPLGEAPHLAELAFYDILDTPAEQGFDDIVLLATRLCDTPAALISFVAQDRQWFKAKIGFNACETLLSQSVCAHGLGQSGLLIIPDLTADPRTCDNTLVTGAPFIRFYAGARLETRNGVAIGMLCVIDSVPRPGGLLPEQAASLEALARQVMAQLELRRAATERDLLVREAHHRVKNSLQMVQSLLSLQARMTAHPEAAQQLQASAMRVRTFGTMHEHLYRAGAAVDVDLEPYLRELLAEQNRALASTLDGRDIRFEATTLSWPAFDAPTVGLILLELVTNALKYGKGLVTVTLGTADGRLSLSVEDEGAALPADFAPANSHGLGMRLLVGLLRGRHGRLDIDRSRPHTCFIASLEAPTAPV